MARKPAAKTANKAPANASAATVDVLNVLQPGKIYKRNAAKYEAARKAYLKVMPAKGPGLTRPRCLTP